jgi:hypothetical protein
VRFATLPGSKNICAGSVGRLGRLQSYKINPIASRSWCFDTLRVLMALGVFVLHDPEFLRRVCRELSTQSNPEKIQDLLSLLRAVVDDDREELALRLHHMAGRYPFLREHSKQ